ncbi:MAG TPA: UdgX family uracil-DNA binding protein [Planctomycetota bacterium]|nr:UdgX family uracil-DNA binding protein [Planctomycetota bacterium]
MIDAAVDDYAGWRRRAWDLLRAQVAPDDVRWRGVDQAQLDLGLDADQPVALATRVGAPPPAFRPLAEQVALHRDPGRWALLYRLLWRLTHGEPLLIDHDLDEDARRASAMAKAVKRDIYWMYAHVRFRRAIDADGERWVAWHAPEHDVLAAAAPFFVDRFGGQRWAILTPGRSCWWDGATLTFGAGVGREAAPVEDAVEDLWITYYASIYNPARPKPRAMLAQMPRRHWATLPEAAQIDALMEASAARVAAMRDAQPDSAARFVPATADWPALRDAAAGCRGCELCGPATRTVFGAGPLDAALVLVGEQPGEDEDRTGRPFTGPAGQVLDRALADAGIDRLRTYLTNAVKHFRFQLVRGMRQHKSPGGAHINACRPWLEAELAIVRPRVIACLGATAAKAILGRAVAVTRERGPVDAPHVRARVIVTFHPSAVLRAPDPASRDATYRALVDDLRLAAAGG